MHSLYRLLPYMPIATIAAAAWAVFSTATPLLDVWSVKTVSIQPVIAHVMP